MSGYWERHNKIRSLQQKKFILSIKNRINDEICIAADIAI